MDASQLITIAVSALVGAVIKELVTWLFGLIKSTLGAKAFWARLRTLFSKENRQVMYDVLAAIVFIGATINFGMKDSAATRGEILLLVGSVVMLLLTLINLLIDIAAIAAKREAERNPLKGA